MLEVADLVVRYGKLTAVDGVSIGVEAGGIVALIGHNGAGKSSLLQAIVGAVRPAAGEVRFDGTRLTGTGPPAAARHGLVLVPEGRMIFTSLTVAENLLIGGHVLRERGGAQARLEEVIGLFPRLRERLASQAAELSGGERQMLAIARGLMARPRLIMLDEPSLGLSPGASRETFDLIARLPDQGVAVLLVEQNVRQALEVAHRGYVLQHGGIVLEGEAQSLLRNDLLITSYLGIAAEETSP